MFKKYALSLSLALSICLSLGTTAFAETFANKKMTMDGIVIETITAEDYDGDVSALLSFETEEEALAYVREMKKEMAEPSSLLELPLVSAYYGNWKVDESEAMIGSQVQLWLAYGTSGSFPHTGKILFAEPYISCVSGPSFMTWTEGNKGTHISSTGKDVYVYANGTVSFTVNTGDNVQFISRNVQLSGNAYLIRH